MAKLVVEPFLAGAGLHIVLSAPKANILDEAMLGELNELLDSLRPKGSLKVLCFSGAAGNFSFGASVAEHVKERAPAMLAAFSGVFKRLADLSIPTVAAVEGRCLGGGMELAAFCNWVFAHPKAIFGQPEIRLGVFPPVAAIILPYKVGQSRADDINVTGRDWSATEAHRIGLVDVLSEEPFAEVSRWAERELLPKSAASLRYAVRASRFGMYAALRRELPLLEELYVKELMATHDANEGIASFLEKRAAVYTDS